VRGSTGFAKVLTPLQQCVLDPLCITPPTLNRHNFRQDQSLFNVLFWSNCHLSDPSLPHNQASSAEGQRYRSARDAAALEAQRSLPPALTTSELMQRVLRELAAFSAAQQSHVVVHLATRFWAFAASYAAELIEPQPAADVNAAEPGGGGAGLVLYTRRRYLNRQYTDLINRECVNGVNTRAATTPAPSTHPK
jgi:hypothetical protein